MNEQTCNSVIYFNNIIFQPDNLFEGSDRSWEWRMDGWIVVGTEDEHKSESVIHLPNRIPGYNMNTQTRSKTRTN